MEYSDDEMDLLGPGHLTVDVISAPRPISDVEMNDETINEEEEILTSDAEELAEIVANKSLENYLTLGPSPKADVQDNKRSEDLPHTIKPADNMQTPIKRTTYRTNPPSSSSPARMTPTSGEEEAHTEPYETSQTAPQSSSPDVYVSRYSPPLHVVERQTQSRDISRLLLPEGNLGEDLKDPAFSVLSEAKVTDRIGNNHIEEHGTTPSAGFDPEPHPQKSVDACLSSPLSPHGSPVMQSLCENMATPSPPFSLPHENHILPTSPDLGQTTLSVRTTSSPSNNLPHASSPLSEISRSPNEDLVSGEQAPGLLPQGRTLRVRTVQQQHPYAFEYAHYKKSMRRAGLDDAIVKLQLAERQKALDKERGQHKQVQPEMASFIVPEDESQDLYVPPPSPPPARESRAPEPVSSSIDMEGLLAGFGGMISDEETPVAREKRRDKGKGKATNVPKKAQRTPRPFPMDVTHRHGHHLSSSPSPEASPSTSRPPRRTPPSPSGSRSSGSQRREHSSQRRESRPMEKDESSQSGSSSTSDSETDESNPDSLAAAERKRFRILNRMMPAAWVRRQLEEHTRKQKARESHRVRQDSPLRPGQARVRTRIRGPDETLVLVGDSESDKDDFQSHSNSRSQLNEAPQPFITPPSQNRSKIRPRVFPAKPPPKNPSETSDNDVVDILSSDDVSSVIDLTLPTADDNEISNWLATKSPKRRGGGGGGGDLINRMLNRTNGGAQNARRRSRKARTGYDQDGRKLKQARLTSMFHASSPDDRLIDVSSSSDATPGYMGATSRAGSKNKKPRRSKTGTTHAPGRQRTFTIHGDLAELLDATISPAPESIHEKKKNYIHNQAVSANVHIREGPGHSQRPVETTPLAGRQTKLNMFSQKSISTDCGIVPFRPHTKFSPSTYIGRGYLQNLIEVATASNSQPVEVTPVVVFGEHLDTRLTGTEFVDQVRRLVPHWTDWLAGRGNETDVNVNRSLRFVALRVTFLLESPPEEANEASFDSVDSGSRAFLEEDAIDIFKVVAALCQTDPATRDISIASDFSWLSFHWFSVEIAVRTACGIRRRALRISETTTLASIDIDIAVQRMIKYLLGYNLADNVRMAYESDGDLIDPVLEIWVCLVYLIDDTEFPGAITWKPLWSRIEPVLDSPEFALPYKVYESERRWEHIFSLSALGAFSCQTGRLLPGHPPISRWPWVCKTIKDIRLKDDKIIEGAKQRRQRVDFYVRVVTARCWLLHTMWGWGYSQPDRLLSLLHPVFQTRKLAKLRDERTDFPLFIRDLDLEHLERFSNGDTAWSIFLKIFRRIVLDNPNGARKLYSAYSPVAVLQFTNENPATDMDLSRLLNSFAIFLVILITDPTDDRGAYCVKRMQDLIVFKNADMRSREACVRAFQYAGLLFKYYQLELGPMVSWLHIILESLQEHLRNEKLLAQRNRLVVLALCLVRSVAAVTSTCGFDRDSKKIYPETALLTSDFVQTIFQLDLKGNVAVRREIRHFLEAFFHARDAFIATLPAKPRQEVTADEESQESYGFDEFDLDLDDPEVLAGLDALEGISPTQSAPLDPFKLKEKHTSKLFSETISPAVFENIIVGFGLDDRRLSSTPERGGDISDESAWIRVWFGCVKIVVENRERTWWDYLNHWGSAKMERISRIVDVGAERRVRIHFCYLALKHTPTLAKHSNKEQKHQLLLPWFQCLPHHRYTVEHKYTALLCDLGLVSDPLLEGLPCQKNDKGEHYVLSSELIAERGNYVQCVLANLSRLSRAGSENPATATFTRAKTCVAKLFETTKQTWDHLSREYAPSADKELIPSYLEFCRNVRSAAEELLIAPSVRELSSRLSWVPLPL